MISSERFGRARACGRAPLCVAATVAAVLWCAGPLPAHVGSDLRLAALNERIAAAPRDPALYLARGEIHRVRREWTRALADYDRAAGLDPGNSAADLCRGRMWLEAGQAGRARASLARFLQRRPAHVAGRVLFARALAATGAHLAAARQLAEAIRRDPNPVPEHYLERAAALAAAGPGHHEEALRALDDGIAKLGPLVTLELAAIDLELAAGNKPAALRRLDRIAAQSERQEPWASRRAEILERAAP